MSREIILQNVVSIKDEKNELLKEKNFQLYYSVNKYYEKKNSIWHVDLNGKHLSKRDKYNFEIKCISCSNIQQVGTTQFLRKINKCGLRCYLCRNSSPSKKEKQSHFMKNNMFAGKNYVPRQNENKNRTFDQKRQESQYLFDQLDDDFKDDYFKYHLTDEDYTRILPHIQGFHNGKLSNVNDYIYIPVFAVNNQMRFSSFLYDKKADSLFKAHQPILKCENCHEIWRAKSLEKFKNDLKITCKTCSFTNKTFCIRKTKNCQNEMILYQSRLELKFINWCNVNNIFVKNGPVIEYDFHGKKKKYRVDFQIENLLIEIKDNHIWYKNDLKSGKMLAKENAVKKELENGKYDYFFLMTPRKWLETIKQIRYSLNSCENKRSVS